MPRTPTTNVNPLNDQNRSVTSDDIIKSSIQIFLTECPKRISNLSGLISPYRKLLDDFPNPPIGIVWCYGIVVFQSCRPSSLLPPGKLLVVEEMLELVNECSCLSSVLRRVAVVAPVVYLLYHLDFNFSAKDPSFREEIGSIVEGIVNDMAICCSQYLDEGDQGSEDLGVHILDLIRIWMVGTVRDRGSEEIDVLASFFPSLDSEFQPEVTVCLGYLAGVVLNETLLLRLRLKISLGIDKEDLPRNVLNVAIQTIKGFQNFYFLGESVFYFAGL